MSETRMSSPGRVLGRLRGPAPGSSDTAADRTSFASSILSAGVWIVFIALCGVFAGLEPHSFLSLATLRNTLDTAAVVGLMGVGLTAVLAVGEFDFSFTGSLEVAGAVSIVAMNKWGLDTGVAVILGVLSGTVVGIANAIGVAYLGASPFIVTLATGSVATGIANGLTGGNFITNGIHSAFDKITSISPLTIPMIVYISLAVAIVIGLALTFTIWGRRLYAVGENRKAAFTLGLPTNRLRAQAFILLGACAGLTGVLLMSEASSYYPDAGASYLIPVYAACFLGANAMRGGRFRPWLTYFGAIFLAVISTGLSLLSEPLWVPEVVQGGVLLVAIGATRWVQASS
jgi:ribose/xylose/arabinose/galactoside ABC-type transport system permease subunit